MQSEEIPPTSVGVQTQEECGDERVHRIDILHLKNHQQTLLEDDLQAVRRAVEKEKDTTASSLNGGILYAAVLLFVAASVLPASHNSSKAFITIALGFLTLTLMVGNWAYLFVYARYDNDLQVEEILSHVYDYKKKPSINEQMTHLSSLDETELFKHKFETIIRGSRIAQQGKLANAAIRFCMAVSIGLFTAGVALALYGH